jgi:hypothetical protein
MLHNSPHSLYTRILHTSISSHHDNYCPETAMDILFHANPAFRQLAAVSALHAEPCWSAYVPSNHEAHEDLFHTQLAVQTIVLATGAS